MSKRTRVSIAISSVRVEFTSLITLRNVDLGEIANTSDLYRRRRIMIHCE